MFARTQNWCNCSPILPGQNLVGSTDKMLQLMSIQTLILNYCPLFKRMFIDLEKHHPAIHMIHQVNTELSVHVWKAHDH